MLRKNSKAFCRRSYFSQGAWIAIICWNFALPLDAVEADTVAPSQVGPRSAEESMLLWMEAKSQFEKGQYDDVIRNLQRYVDRYPGTKSYDEAHFILGQSYLKRGQSKKAIAPLKFYVEAKKKSPEGMSARLILARAYDQSGKFHEALITAEECLGAEALPGFERGQALLLKAQALLSLGQDTRVREALDAFVTLNGKEKIPNLIKTEAYLVEARYQSRLCSHLPVLDKKGAASEADVRRDLLKRGNCVLEAQGFAQKATALEADSPFSMEARRVVSQAFSSYEKACRNPPPPPAGSLETQGPMELKRYKQELADRLLKDSQEVLSKKIE